MSAFYIRDQKITVEFRRNLLLSLKIIFFFLSLFSVVDPEWFIPDAFPTFLVVPDPEENFKKAKSNSGKFCVYTVHCTYTAETFGSIQLKAETFLTKMEVK
jgi:hypothetical protein